MTILRVQQFVRDIPLPVFTHTKFIIPNRNHPGHYVKYSRMQHSYCTKNAGMHSHIVKQLLSVRFLQNPDYMKDSFYINIESMHLPDRGHTENALDLSPALLKKREVIVIDIYDDSLLKKTDITPETNVHEFKSKKTGREKLSKDWIQTTKPVMCCYKVVQVQFKMFGFQTMVEHMLQRQYPRIFAKFNRELYCWIDRWYDMTIDDIREMEREMVEELKKKIAEPEKRGIVCDVDEKSN
ncbi:unnamed protein product [Onchocerca flexuosa]|uniref:Phosphatidylinositol transfer protein n=1 Tax=Onchocerca flexuosa TaxID=387005 RepID=A0A183HF19_9BILA|nr:unnamed protein product [Onchocerca flexuosa]